MKIKFLAISFIIFAVPFFISIEAKANQILDTNGWGGLNSSTLDDSGKSLKDRLMNWDAGVRGGIPNVPTKIDAVDYGVTPNDDRDDAGALQDAIDACVTMTPCAVFLPEGEYRVNGRINFFSGVVLRGAGPDKTRILVRPNTNNKHTFRIGGNSNTNGISLSQNAAKGANRVVVRNASSFSKDQIVQIKMNNENFMINMAENDTRQQIMKITNVNSDTNTLTFDVPLRLSYPLSNNPRVYIVNPRENIGFEDFYVKHISSDNDSSNIFQFWIVNNSWIKNVESDTSAAYHVKLFKSRYITIQDSIFHHSYNYGGGGHGYGISTDQTCDSLMVNNVFYKLRHAMITGHGSNGNVWAYNFSADDYSQDDQIGLAELNLHGNYSYLDLFEGNVFQWAKMGGWWGQTGPYNTLFRNRQVKQPYTNPTNLYRAGLEIDHPSDSQNIIGNYFAAHIKNTGDIAQSDAFDYAQYLWIEKNIICRDGIEGRMTDNTLIDNVENCQTAAPWQLPVSLYFSQKPYFWPNNLPWPAIGADIDSQRLASGNDLYKIPAQIRYEKIMGTYEEPTPTDSPVGPQCLNIQLLDQNNQVIAENQSLQLNDQIKFVCQTDPLANQTIKFRMMKPNATTYSLENLNSDLNDNLSDLYTILNLGDFVVQCAVCDAAGNNCTWE